MNNNTVFTLPVSAGFKTMWFFWFIGLWAVFI